MLNKVDQKIMKKKPIKFYKLLKQNLDNLSKLHYYFFKKINLK